MARIASRTAIEPVDLRFLEELGPQVSPVVERYFTLSKLKSLGVSENFNRSVAARRRGNREEAWMFLKRAFDLAGESS
jgi:hypothetical protein